MKSFFVIAFGVFAAQSVSADDCKFSKDHSVNVDLAGAKRIVLGTGAGDLTVRGEDGRAAANASGRACASSQELLDEIQIETRREGDAVYIKTVMPSWDDETFAFRRYAYLDLAVLVPKTAVLSLEDSSGDLKLSNVQSASVADSSGDQNIRDIAGALEVSDSSGDIEIERVGGKLTLKDSSGDVDVDEVTGDVEVIVDSSGALDIERVAGSVHIRNDSSGEIDISDVQRDVTIDVDSSGSIRVERVGGNFTVRSDGSGGISHDRVMGKVQIPERD